MEKEELIKILKQYISFDENEVFYKSEIIDEISLIKVKEAILGYGEIFTQNLEEGYIIASLTKGISAFSNATVVISVDENKVNILSYAKEGLINQNIALKNIDNIISLIKGEKIKQYPNINHFLISAISIFAILLVINIVRNNRHYTVTSSPTASPTFHSLVQNTIIPTEDDEPDNEDILQVDEQREELILQYNTVIGNLNTITNSYNQEVIELSIDNIENLPKELELHETLTEEAEKNNDEIKSDILELSEQLEVAIENYAVIHKLYELDENEIISILSQLENVENIEAVTNKNDPNKMLGKDGGYISCVYFTLDLVDADNVPGDGVIGKGTDAGGCIELYKTVEEAMNRCEYLKDFDDTLLYSGSYAIVGKSVIRTSYLLTNEQQINITKQIVDKLVSLS